MKLPDWFGARATPGSRLYGEAVDGHIKHRFSIRSARFAPGWVTDGKAAFAAVAPGWPLIPKAGAKLAGYMRAAKNPAAIGEIKLYAQLVGEQWVDSAYLALGVEAGAVAWRANEAIGCVVGFTASGDAVAIVMSIRGGPKDKRDRMTPAEQLEAMKP